MPIKHAGKSGGIMSDITVNIEQALRQPNYAKALWLNYHKGSNTLNISDFDIGRIEATWENLIPKWQQSSVVDENVYDFEFSLDDWNNAVEEGEEQGKNLTGYEATGWQKTGQIARCAADGTIAAATGLHAAYNGTKGVVNFGGQLLGKGSSAASSGVKTVSTGTSGINIINSGPGDSSIISPEAFGEEGMQIGTQAGTQAGGEVAKKTITDAFLLIACAFDVTNAAWYLASKPNEEQSNAVNALAEDMGNQQAATMGAQNDLVTMDDELQTAADEAYVVNDDANTYMGEQKTMYDFYAGTLEYLEAAKTAGHQFNKDELKLYEESIQYMTAISDDIGVTQENTTDAVTEVSENMSTYQTGFDEVAETAGNVQGITDYAESIDESTQTMCTVEKYSQMVSGGAAGVDAVRAAAQAASSAITIGGAIIYGAAAVASAAAAVMDTKASAEQGQMAEQAGMEIEMRAQTQDMNTNTQELYDSGIDNYEAYTESVEDLEMEVPDDIEAPEIVTLPTEDPSNDGNNDDDENKHRKI